MKTLLRCADYTADEIKEDETTDLDWDFAIKEVEDSDKAAKDKAAKDLAKKLAREKKKAEEDLQAKLNEEIKKFEEQ
jgi:hypothetical protein